MSTYLDAVRQRVVIYDGATGTNLQLRELTADDFGGPAFEGCNEILVDTRPDVIADLHRSFFEVGSEVVETDSFGSLSITLAEYGIADRAYELNRKAAEIAREVADGFTTPDTPRWVAGSIGPGTKFPSLGQIRFAEMRDAYEVQARGLLDGGVDLFIIETVFDLLQAKAAIIGCRRAMAAVGRQVPIQVQVTIELTGRMLPGTEIGAALTALEAMRPDVIGLNCATGPAEMHEHLRHLSQHCRVPISCLPNAGLPSVVDGKMHYDLTPDQLAEYHAGFVTELGVTVIGGCCGTTPEHLKAVDRPLPGPHARARATPSTSRARRRSTPTSPSSQDTSFLVVGERTNANGSKKFRDAMLASDWDTCVAMARDQVKEGAHLLDVCVDYTGEDGVADMDEIARRFATQASLPLVLDSTEPPVIEAGLQWIGGKAVLNSVNLEDGDAPGTRLDRFLTPGPGVRGGGRLHLHRPGGPGPHRGVEAAVGQGHPRPGRRPLRPGAVRPALRRPGPAAVDRHGGEPAGRHRDHRGHPPHQGRAARASTPSSACRTCRSASRPAARHVLNSVFLHECVRGRARRGHRPRGPHHAAQQDPRAAARGLPRPRLRPAHATATTRCRSCWACSRACRRPPLVKEDRSGWPVERAAQAAHHRRRPRRPHRRPRRGPRHHARPRHRQRHPAGRDEGGRRPVRARARCSCRSCSSRPRP